MNEQSKQAKNWSLIIGLAIPVLMVIFIAISIYLPRILDNTPAPSIDYIYSSNNHYPHALEVKNGRLEWTVKENDNYRSNNDKPPRLYLHNVKTNSSKEINLEEAQQYLLDSRARSRDGYIIEMNRHSGFFFITGPRYRNHFLVNGLAAHKQNLEYLGNSYYNFNFLGWVIEQD